MGAYSSIRNYIIGLAIKRKARVFVSKLGEEASETGQMLVIISRHVRGETITEEEEKLVREQFYDVLKIAGIGIPFFLVPGASVLLPIIVRMAKKRGIELMPSSFND